MIGALLRRVIGQDRFYGIRKSIRGQNNSIDYQKASLNSVHFDIEGNDNRISIADGCTLNGVTFYIRGHRHRISIGPCCRFNRSGSIWIEDQDCTLNIGEGSTFEAVAIALTEPGSRIDIGQDCMFAYDIEIRCGDSHSILLAENGQRLNYAQDVQINDHVWVATRCLILKGVHIAHDSVIATGSVVTQRFDKAGIIIGGNPARELKSGITWSRKRIYDKMPDDA